jgi:hypothetical protein
MACFGAFSFLLCFWYFDAACAAAGQFVEERTPCEGVNLFFRLLEREIVFCGNELEERLEGLVVGLQGRLQHSAWSGHYSRIPA